MKKLLLLGLILTGCTTHTVVKTSYQHSGMLDSSPNKSVTSETYLYGTLKQILKGSKDLIKFADDEYLYNRNDK